jgi:membrane-associated protease RseP (regulator of RpoE activity)
MAMTDAPPQPAGPPHDGQPQADGTGRGSIARLAALVAVVVLIGVQGGLPWLFIIGAIVVMIFLHELGHFLTAKWAGMKVTQFFLGFGPTIWSFRRGETEYGLKAVPAGAFVKVIGMYGIDEVDPADEHRTYRQKKFYQRVVMAAAGSTMHFVLALVLLFGALVGIGRQQLDDWTVAAISPGSAAEMAGLQPGDRLVSIDGVPVADWADMREAITPLAGETVPVVYERAGETVTVQATIGTNPQRPSDGQLGVGPTFPYSPMAPGPALVEAGKEFAAISVASVKGLTQLFSPSGIGSFVRQVAEGRPEPSDGGGTGTVAAPSEEDNRFLSIYGAARLGADLTRAGVAPALGFLAVLNIFIGLFNLIPLLPFDGGHIAIATYERLREFRTAGRRHFTDVSRLLPLTYAVVMLLVAIGVSSFYLDFVNPITLP